MKTYDLGFGNSICVRQALLETYDGNLIVFSHDTLSRFDYPNHEGDPELVEMTRQIIYNQTNKKYKHILLTNGATGGVVISLRAFAQKGKKYCRTRNAPYYVRYPQMIKASGLQQISEDEFKANKIDSEESVTLLDVPSNPLGKMKAIDDDSQPVILDGVYMNAVYLAIPPIFIPKHDILVGSYSKLLGINGIRVGWIATDDDLLYERLKPLVISEYCGLSSASTEILKTILTNFNWSKFTSLAQYKLDSNREEWSKLEKFFGNTPVMDSGMFYYAPMDNKAQELFKRSGVTWTKGSALGTDDSFARFNLGQDNAMIREVVKTILRNDTIK